MHNGGEHPRWKDHAVRNRFQPIAYFFDSDDHCFRGKHGFFLDADDSPQLDIAPGVRALRVNDRDVGIHGSNRRDFLSCEWTVDESNGRRMLREIGFGIPPQNAEWQPRGSRGQGRGEPRVVVLFEFEWNRPSLLDGIPEPMQQPQARISGPRKDQFSYTTHADHLIANQVSTEPYER